MMISIYDFFGSKIQRQTALAEFAPASVLTVFPRLNDRHVVFGQVTDGMDIVRKMESFGTHEGGTLKKIVITDCGELK